MLVMTGHDNRVGINVGNPRRSWEAGWLWRDWIAAIALFVATAAVVLWQNSRLGALWDLSYILGKLVPDLTRGPPTLSETRFSSGSCACNVSGSGGANQADGKGLRSPRTLLRPGRRALNRSDMANPV
jgi:hypothetical protein